MPQFVKLLFFLPSWLEEGACQTYETKSENSLQQFSPSVGDPEEGGFVVGRPDTDQLISRQGPQISNKVVALLKSILEDIVPSPHPQAKCRRIPSRILFGCLSQDSIRE